MNGENDKHVSNLEDRIVILSYRMTIAQNIQYTNKTKITSSSKYDHTTRPVYMFTIFVFNTSLHIVYHTSEPHFMEVFYLEIIYFIKVKII
jgi:hypothetical protein